MNEDSIIDLIQKCDTISIMHKSTVQQSCAHLATLLHSLLPLKPISCQNDDEVQPKIVETQLKLIDNLSLVDFITNFYSNQLPVKIIKANQNINFWNFNNLYENLRARLFPVEIGGSYTDKDWKQEIMTFSDFYAKFIEDDYNNESELKKIGYIAQFDLLQTIPGLIEHLHIPDYCQVGDENIHINFWIGPKGTKSPLHFDIRDNIFTQLFGTKKIYLINPEGLNFPLMEGFSNTAQLSLEEAIQTVPEDHIFCMTISGGEMLYIPKGWWHFVESLTKSISVSFWF